MPTVEPETEVFFLDFCPTAAEVEQLLQQRCWVTILDHHEGVEPRLQALKANDRTGRFSYTYNKQESGATLCWEHWFRQEPQHTYLRYVRDIDLYDFKLDQSRAIKHALYASVRALSFKEQMALLDCWATMSAAEFVEVLGTRGKPLWAEVQQIVKGFTEPAKVGRAVIAGHRVPFVFAQGCISEVGEALYTRYPEEPFVAIAQIQGERIQWHLRSNKHAQTPFFVYPVAQQYGGNGHKHAAAFRAAPDAIQYKLETELSDVDRIHRLLKGRYRDE